MTTAKIAVAQQIQGIQRFFISQTVKDRIIEVGENDVNAFEKGHRKLTLS